MNRIKKTHGDTARIVVKIYMEVINMWKKELIRNKIYSLLLMIIGFLSISIENDVTVFVFTCIIGVPIFFSKENLIERF